MIQGQTNKYLSYITSNAKDEKTNEEFKNMLLSIAEKKNKKSRDF